MEWRIREQCLTGKWLHVEWSIFPIFISFLGRKAKQNDITRNFLEWGTRSGAPDWLMAAPRVACSIWQYGRLFIFFKVKVRRKPWWLCHLTSEHLTRWRILHLFQKESHTQAMMTSDKMAIRHHAHLTLKQFGWRTSLLALRQGIFSLKSCTSRNLTAKFSRILHSCPFARQQVWISQNGSVLKKRNFFLFLDHRLMRWSKSGRRTTFYKLLCKIEMFHQSRQIGKVGKEQTSRHLLPAWRSHNAMQEVISTFIARDGKIWQFLQI